MANNGNQVTFNYFYQYLIQIDPVNNYDTFLSPLLHFFREIFLSYNK